MKKLLAALFLCLAAVPSWADDTRSFFTTRDVTETNFIYCVTGNRTQGQYNIKTTGSSTTVTAVSGTPFASTAVGDEITVAPLGVNTTRYVTAVASAVSITVNTAVNWSNGGAGYSWSYRPVVCGTTATDGWVGVQGAGTKYIQVIINTFNATGIIVQVEGKLPGLGAAASIILGPITYTTAGNKPILTIPEGLDGIRLGIKVDTATGAQSVTGLLYVVRNTP